MNSNIIWIDVKTKNKLEYIKHTDVAYLMAEGNYAIIFLKDGSRKTVSKGLSDFEAMLCISHFCRCHKSYIINTHCVNHIFKLANKTMAAVVCDDKQIPIARRKMKLLTDCYK